MDKRGLEVSELIPFAILIGVLIIGFAIYYFVFGAGSGNLRYALQNLFNFWMG